MVKLLLTINPTKMKNQIEMNSGGNFCTILQTALIILKLTGSITWSWWWVLSPMWAPIVFILLLCGLFLAALIVAACCILLTSSDKDEEY